MADKYCSVRFKTGEELDEALNAAMCACDDAARAEAAALRAEEAAERAENGGGGSGEAGADGFSPVATVTQTDTGATISITDKNGTTTATVVNGKDGAQGIPGEPGSDYVLTEADKQEIAELALTKLPTWNGGSY